METQSGRCASALQHWSSGKSSACSRTMKSEMQHHHPAVTAAAAAAVAAAVVAA